MVDVRTVALVQRLLGVRITGVWDEATARAVREFQRESGLLVTGLLDPPTERMIRSLPTRDLVPSWFCSDDRDRVVAERLGDEDAVRRFQSAAGLFPSGVVDEETARRLGE